MVETELAIAVAVVGRRGDLFDSTWWLADLHKFRLESQWNQGLHAGALATGRWHTDSTEEVEAFVVVLVVALIEVVADELFVVGVVVEQL